MKKINWSGHKWITQERWGEVHKDKKLCHYDETAVNVDKDNILHLQTKYNPKNFELYGEKFTSDFGVGLICSEEDFEYGHFEIECMLPKGNGQWPAFWMWGAESWPPEIDFFEAYSSKRGCYFKPKLFPKFSIWDIKSNVHYRANNEIGRDTAGSSGGWIGWKNPSKHYIKYECLWTPDFIEIKYNGRVVNKVTNKKILADVNSQKHRLIINNHLRWSVDKSQITDFKVKYFKYTPLN